MKYSVRLLFSFAFLLAFATFANAQQAIVKDGKSLAQIILSDHPTRMTKLAAEELQNHIEKITGAKLPISTSVDKEIPVQIYVGKSSYTDQLNITDAGLKNDAFRMVSGKNYLVLLGHDSEFTPKEPFMRDYPDAARAQKEWDKLTGETWGFPAGNLYKEYSDLLKIWDCDERGSLNAVYEYLRMQGVRWYLPDPLGEIIPKKSTLLLPQIDRTVIADFALRLPYQMGREFAHEAATREEVLWRLRLGETRAHDLIGEMGVGLSHGIAYVHSRKEVMDAHPEYYMLVGDQRDMKTMGEGRPCLSSQGLFEQNVKFVRAIFDIYDAPMVSVMPQDGYANLCSCDLCRDKGVSERGWEGQMSDYVWGYVNRVAQEVYKTHPNKKVSCFAYTTYKLPPEKIAQMSPNLVVGITQNCWLFGDPQERKKFDDLRQAWLAKLPQGSKQLIIYDYYLHASPRNKPGVPFFFPHRIAEDLHSLRDISMGEFIEVHRDKKGMASLGIDHLNLYITSRFWWDANQNVDALLDEYYTDYFGPARNEMKTFIEYCETNIADMDKHIEKIDRINELLAKAQSKVDADTVYGKRIAMIADYIKPMKALRDQLAVGRGNVPEALAFDRDPKQITLDGKLDDVFWEKQRVYKLSELQTGREPACPTEFRIGWASDALYIGIRCTDPDTQHLNIGTTKNEDTNLWNGDAVEILLETQSHQYYQIAFNPAGAMMDLDRKDGLNSLWNSGAQIATYTGDHFWSAEIRLPVAGDQQEVVDKLNGISGRKPIEAFPWYFNICRQRVRTKDTEASAFSPTGVASFHEVLKFAKLYVR